MRIVFYSASTSAHSNSSTKTTYQPFRADTWDEMDRLYPDCEFVVAGPLNGSYIFDVADGEICKKPEKVKYVLLESGMSAEDTAELIAQQRPDIAVAIASGAVPFDWVPIKTALIAEELQKEELQPLPIIRWCQWQHLISGVVISCSAALSKRQRESIFTMSCFLRRRRIRVSV